MPAGLHERIQKSLQKNANQTARELAAEFGVDRSEVNSLLYADKTTFQKDSAHIWSLRGLNDTKPTPTRTNRTGSGLLAKICNYYLDCLAREVEYDVNVWAASKFGRPDYVELDAFPGSGAVALTDSAAQNLGSLVFGKRKNTSRVAVLVGYPVFVSTVRLKDGGTTNKLYPLFYSKVAGSNFSPLQLEELRPEPIISSFARLLGESTFEVLGEVRDLMTALNFDGTAASWETFSENFEQLPGMKSEWLWKETGFPEPLAKIPRLSEVTEPGIYNRAIAWVTEEANYTVGLREELGKLAAMEDQQVAGTALGHWLGVGGSTAVPNNTALLEPLSLNSEQREAVRQAMVAPLTVVTGPPGTGKSQVLASIVVNSIHSGGSVLVASKNNRAVEVVIDRVNGLAAVPSILRLGANEHFGKMHEALSSLLGSPPNKADYDLYAAIERDYGAVASQWRDVHKQVEQTMLLRNSVDSLEADCELSRSRIYPQLFKRWMIENKPGTQGVWSFKRQVQDLYCRWPKPLLPLWRMLRARALRQTASQVASLGFVANYIDLPLPATSLSWDTLDTYIDLLTTFEERLQTAEKIHEYGFALKNLMQQPRIEAGAAKLAEIEQRIAKLSTQLWRAWLATKPALQKPNARQELSRLQAVVSILSEPGYSRESQDARKRLVAQFKGLIQYVPAWAVTNLSARGRVPFEPGIFDLVVIDEASQCDIASAIPLLYRSKRAAIIGDPKQLSHISSITKGIEDQLLDKYGLSNRSEWTYSKQSLYDMAVSVVKEESVVGLREHHRSDAQIIGFSNWKFYDSKLRIATRYDRLKRPTYEANAFRWIDVQGKTERPPTGSARNDIEADTVIDELKRLLIENAYEGSVGVVTPFRAQVQRINDKLSHDPLLKQVAFRSGVTIDTVDRFQGDERDVILFSVVAASNAPASTILFLAKQENRLNVALTRARAMLIVIGDRSFLARSNAEKFAALARYEPGNADIGSGNDVRTASAFVSEWEEILQEILLQAGIETEDQVPVEQYSLDLAVTVGKRKLDIEVDGEAYHRAWDGERLTRDLIRDRRVIELGWDVMRFWVYEIRDYPDECVNRVKKWANAAERSIPLQKRVPKSKRTE